MNKLQTILEDAGYDPHSYSGRCMYGQQCLAVTLDSETSAYTLFSDVLEYLISCDEDRDELSYMVAQAFRGARDDSMGRGSVIYFPRIAFDEA
jgi:hypothetical protein